MPFSPVVMLLETTEHLIHAHQSAKRFGDRTAVELIESAMFHVGAQLSEESNHRVGREVLAILGKERGGRTHGGG